MGFAAAAAAPKKNRGVIPTRPKSHTRLADVLYNLGDELMAKGNWIGHDNCYLRARLLDEDVVSMGLKGAQIAGLSSYRRACYVYMQYAERAYDPAEHKPDRKQSRGPFGRGPKRT
jgi:hypothetical protein